MKTNIKRLIGFSNAANSYLKIFPEETKFEYAIRKVVDRIKPCFHQYNELKNDIELDNANTNANGSVLYKIENNARVYEFTKQGLKTAQEQLNALSLEDRFEFEEYFAAEIPDNIPVELLPFFEGFVIKENDEQSAS